MGDLPAQAGMGSSSSFTVGLLHALHVYHGASVTPEWLAAQACRIEIERLGEPIGKQDQYIAAYGGLRLLQFERDGSVTVEPVDCSSETVRELDRRLLIFFSGMTRNARDILASQQRSVTDNLDSLAELSDIARRMRDILTSGGDLDEIGLLLHNAWEHKKALEPSVTRPELDAMYERGRRAGALGGKILGAGGGGFLILYCRPELQGALRSELAELAETPFSMVSDGTRVVYPEERSS
jgi:D-glycero-alpha-D-manno-heptose-7-phosphate kinase